jgi:hypothetical protein
MSIVQKILGLREGGYVKRCHTLMYVGEYNNAMHGYGVASLLLVLHPNPSKALIEAALWHDVHERWTGDLPSPALGLSTQLRESVDILAAKAETQLDILQDDLTEEEYQWLKACDYMELFLWVVEQGQMGNRIILNVLRKMLTELTKRRDEGKLPQPIVEFFETFNWERLPDADEFLGGKNECK